jgi:hypothetical protein
MAIQLRLSFGNNKQKCGKIEGVFRKIRKNKILVVFKGNWNINEIFLLLNIIFIKDIISHELHLIE